MVTMLVSADAVFPPAESAVAALLFR
jgi:hypothetical protein